MRPLNSFVNESSDKNLLKLLGVNTSDEGNAYLLAASVAVTFANNLKHIHFHIKGEKFDEIHSITQQYYAMAEDDADYLAELCLEMGYEVPNFSHLPNIQHIMKIATEPKYDYTSAIGELSLYMQEYIACLKDLRDLAPSDVSSKLDEFIRYWTKEQNFKNEQRIN